MEIVSLSVILKYDLIIFNWWIEESDLVIRYQNKVYEVIDLKTVELRSNEICESIHAEHSVDEKLSERQRVFAVESFSIEWDETFLLEDVDLILCKFIYYIDDIAKIYSDET
jgi:hypothetical protein